MINSIIKANRICRCITFLLAIFSGLFIQSSLAETPEKIYSTQCAYCHSRNLPPFLAPELRGRALPPILTTTFVRNGAKGMITFTKADITDLELKALAEWISTSSAPIKPSMPSPSAGAPK